MEGRYDKGRIPNGTVEQYTDAGTGSSRLDLWGRRIVHSGVVRQSSLYRACGYRCDLLKCR